MARWCPRLSFPTSLRSPLSFSLFMARWSSTMEIPTQGSSHGLGWLRRMIREARESWTMIIWDWWAMAAAYPRQRQRCHFSSPIVEVPPLSIPWAATLLDPPSPPSHHLHGGLSRGCRMEWRRRGIPRAAPVPISLGKDGQHNEFGRSLSLYGAEQIPIPSFCASKHEFEFACTLDSKRQ